MNKSIFYSLAIVSMFLVIPISTIATEVNEELSVTVTIETIRSLEKTDKQVHFEKIFDSNSDPDFYVKIWIDGNLFVSDIYWNTKYLYDLNFQATVDVPIDAYDIPITIQLWEAADDDNSEDRLCDLNSAVGNSIEANEINLIYLLNTGHWSGDDERGDLSGYGRLNGCDDESFYEQELDCELWFDITQSDPDGDGIPSWVETNWYNTDPAIDDTGLDSDNDNVSIEWEWRWGYDPLIWEDHMNIDPDGDSISNWEEYYMRNWSSDPYRVDLFVEMDQMMGPNGEPGMFPEGAKEILYTAYDRQNVVYHLDDGSMGEESCADLIPFDELTECSWGEFDELDQIYENYYLNQDTIDIRRGIFHYGVVIYQSSQVNGNAFGANRYQISAGGMESKIEEPILNLVSNRDVVYASAYMHEMGHSLNFRPIPGHNQFSYYPWQIGYWLSRCYKSCMNYGYMFYTVDYSDGTHGYNDYDDWERMDLSYFERDW
jgi:hypothetical protein